MPLAAATVIDALAARVAGQAGIAAASIKTTRWWPWAESDLPACRVYATGEDCELVTVGSPINQHTLQVAAQYTCRAVADLDDAMHALASGGLALLFADPVPYGLELVGIDRSTATEGEAAVGVITLRMTCLFHVDPRTPETIS